MICRDNISFKKLEEAIDEVEDNGVGFEKAKKQATMKMGGVGVKNVNKRIQFYYGEEYGVRVDQEYKTGARVIISLPLV